MKSGHLILRKIFKFVATMLDFKAKMHQIQFQSAFDLSGVGGI